MYIHFADHKTYKKPIIHLWRNNETKLMFGEARIKTICNIGISASDKQRYTTNKEKVNCDNCKRRYKF